MPLTLTRHHNPREDYYHHFSEHGGSGPLTQARAHVIKSDDEEHSEPAGEPAGAALALWLRYPD